MDERSKTLSNLFRVILFQSSPRTLSKWGMLIVYLTAVLGAVFFRIGQYLALILNKRKVVFFCHTTIYFYFDFLSNKENSTIGVNLETLFHYYHSRFFYY